MGTFHLVIVLMHPSMLPLLYMFFCYLLSASRLVEYFLMRKEKRRFAELFGAISILVLTVPLVLSMVFTILKRRSVEYPFYWMIFAYAFYAFLKIGTALYNLFKKGKRPVRATPYLSLVGALYTMFMMQDAMLNAYGEAGEFAYLMRLYSQGAVFLVSLFLASLLFIRFLRAKEIDAAS